MANYQLLLDPLNLSIQYISYLGSVEQNLVLINGT